LLGGLGASGFLFFIAGAALGPPALSRLTRGRSAALLMAASLPPVLLYLSLGRDELLLDLLLMRVPSTLLLICGTRLLVENCALVGRGLQQLGRVSLRIFLAHPFALALAMALWTDQTGRADAMTTWLALLGLTAGGTFYLQGVFDRLSGGLAYRPPAWLSLASLTAPPPLQAAARRRRGAPSRPGRPSQRGG
jgi:peptidoglycan/LPS O-acetylase OafA/YrhL